MMLEGKQSILKTRDLAFLLDLSPDVVNDMARRGHLKGFKSGNQWRVRRRDVERYIDRIKTIAPPGGLEHPAKDFGALERPFSPPFRNYPLPSSKDPYWLFHLS